MASAMPRRTPNQLRANSLLLSSGSDEAYDLATGTKSLHNSSDYQSRAFSPTFDKEQCSAEPSIPAWNSFEFNEAEEAQVLATTANFMHDLPPLDFSLTETGATKTKRRKKSNSGRKSKSQQDDVVTPGSGDILTDGQPHDRKKSRSPKKRQHGGKLSPKSHIKCAVTITIDADPTTDSHNNNNSDTNTSSTIAPSTQKPAPEKKKKKKIGKKLRKYISSSAGVKTRREDTVHRVISSPLPTTQDFEEAGMAISDDCAPRERSHSSEYREFARAGGDWPIALTSLSLGSEATPTDRFLLSIAPKSARGNHKRAVGSRSSSYPLEEKKALARSLPSKKTRELTAKFCNQTAEAEPMPTLWLPVPKGAKGDKLGSIAE